MKKQNEENYMVDNNEYMRIVKKYRKPLFKYCYYRLCHDKTLTEETIDDVLCILYRKWDTLDLSGNIRAYLYRVADNCIKRKLDNHRKYYKHNESLDEAIENNRFDHMYQCDDYFNGDESTDEKHIERIKQVLPEEYRKIFVYRYIEKKTLVEISELTKIPYSSLRLRISKVEKMVREEIKKIFG